MKTDLSREERRQHTYIGTAEVRQERTDKRDWLIEQGEAAGFVVTCTEAIPISLSGAAGPDLWSITYYEKGILDKMQTQARKADLGKIFAEYRRKF